MRTWPPWNSSLGWSPRSLLGLLGGWVILSCERIRAWGSGVRKASDDVDVAEAQKERLRYGSFTAKVTSILSCFEIACLVIAMAALLGSSPHGQGSTHQKAITHSWCLNCLSESASSQVITGYLFETASDHE